MENRIKYLRLITRGFSLIITALLIFVAFSDKKLIYIETVDYLKKLKTTHLNSNYIINRLNDINPRRSLSIIEQEIKEKKGVNVKISIPNFIDPTSLLSDKSLVTDFVERDSLGIVLYKYTISEETKILDHILDEFLKNHKFYVRKGDSIKIEILPADNISFSRSREDNLLLFINEFPKSLEEPREMILEYTVYGKKYSSIYVTRKKGEFKIEKIYFVLPGIIYSQEVVRRPKPDFIINKDVYSKIKNLNMETALAYCKIKYEEAGSGLSVLGLKIDKDIVAIFGPLTILLLMIHFLLHINGLENFIRNKNITEVEEPWFGLYSGKLAKLSISFVYFLFPFSSALIIYTKTITADTNPFIPVLILSTLVLFCLYILRVITRIRGKLLQKSAVPEPEPMKIIGFHRKSSNDDNS